MKTTLILPLFVLLFTFQSAHSIECNTLLSNSEGRNYEVYAQSMDASMHIKADIVFPWIPESLSGEIIDVGTGTGSLAELLAYRYPKDSIVGVDLNQKMLDYAIAKTDDLANLSFRLSNANTPFATKAKALIYVSIFHEIYSYNNYSKQAVREALVVARNSLAVGGRIIVSDFVRPSDGDRPMNLVHYKNDIAEGRSFEDFVAGFGRKVTLKNVIDNGDHFIYSTTMADAYEYMFRKDYHDNWSNELNETYGFWTIEQARNLFKEAGFSVIHSKPSQNDWIVSNRLEEKLFLVDPTTGKKVNYPDYKIEIVAEVKK